MQTDTKLQQLIFIIRSRGNTNRKMLRQNTVSRVVEDKMCISKQTIETVHDKFKLLRMAAGWTAQQTARELGVSRQTVVNIENKKTPFSKMHCLAFLAVLNERGTEVPDLKKIMKAVLQ